METGTLSRKVPDRNRLLYPMLVIAAVSVIIFSAFGVATMTGLLPHAESMGPPLTLSEPTNHVSNADKKCGNCGVVESITPVEVRGTGTGTGLDAIADGIAGALVGNQIGRCNGNAVATVAGAAGGDYAGNEIEKNMKKARRYQICVRMNDSVLRTTYQSLAPAFAVGEKVKLVNGQIVAPG